MGFRFRVRGVGFRVIDLGFGVWYGMVKKREATVNEEEKAKLLCHVGYARDTIETDSSVPY